MTLEKNNVCDKKYISFDKVLITKHMSKYLFFEENNKIYRSRFFKDYKNNQIIVFNIEELKYVNHQANKEIKLLAVKYGVPLMHGREIRKLRIMSGGVTC